MTDVVAAPPNAKRIGLSLFLLSSGAVLFSLSLFRLISFFIMPSLFFDLLLVCFPVGATLAMLRKGEARAMSRFQFSLPLLQCVMILTIAATLMIKHFDFMRDNLLFDVSPISLALQVVIFSLIYSPFFAFYGATEYLGYLAGRESLAKKMSGVYALVLFGAAVGFLLSLLQEFLGVARLLMLSLLLLTIVKSLFNSQRRYRYGVEALIIVLVLAIPQTNIAFMQLFKSNKPFSAADYAAKYQSNSLHQGWGRYAYFEVLETQQGDRTLLHGLYNDMSQWSYRPGDDLDLGFRESIMQPLVKNADSIAIIGAGGGRDVKLVKEMGVDRVLAMDIESSLQHIIQGKLAEKFENVYDQPGVDLLIGDARTYLENTDEKFDAIFFWSVGGYPQLMLEPGNMIRTEEALGAFMDRLNDDGFFALGYDSKLDPDKVLLQQYATTLRKLGATVVAFDYGDPVIEYALIAFSPKADREQLAEWMRELANHPKSIRDEPIQQMKEEDLIRERFSPITDDQPYLAGNISNILSVSDVKTLFYLTAVGLLLVVGTIYYLILSQQGSAGHRNYSVQLMAFLLGANFLMLEHICVLEIFRQRYIYYDALMIGVVLYLTLTGIGSLMVSSRWTRLLIMLSWVGPILWLVWMNLTGTGVIFTALLLATLVTGCMFPMLFEANPRDRLHIFALDAIGAAAGAMVAFFVPILFGMTAFRIFALAAYLVTTLYFLGLKVKSSNSETDLNGNLDSRGEPEASIT